MTKFNYLAMSPLGVTQTGVEIGESAGAVRLSLIDNGFRPIEVSEKRSILQFEITKKRVPRKDLMHFCRQLGVFVKAGMPIIDGLELIATETSQKELKKVVTEMAESLRAGATFASAAAAHPEAFQPFHLGMLQSAELTGNLDVVLARIAQYIDRDCDARSRLTSALVYPAIVLLAAIGTIIVMATFVLPRFQTFFASLNAKLPLPTRMLIGACSFLSSTWMLLIGGAAALAALLALTLHSPTGRARIDAIILKLPIIGDLVEHAILERVCRILSSMLRAGVSLPEAINVSSTSTNNAVYRRGLGFIRDKMLEGQGIAGPLAETGLFKGPVQQIFRIVSNWHGVYSSSKLLPVTTTESSTTESSASRACSSPLSSCSLVSSSDLWRSP